MKLLYPTAWSEIETSNKLAEDFSQIGRDMVPLPFGIEIHTTDKESIIRAQLYKMVQRLIDHAYACLEGLIEGKMKPILPDLEEYLMKLLQPIVGPQLSHPPDDLFAMGMNSLQAIQIRGRIERDLDLGANSNKLGQNVIFEQGNLETLTKYLHSLRLNVENDRENPVKAMENLFSKYSVAQKSCLIPRIAPSRHIVVSRHVLPSTLANCLLRFLPAQLEGWVCTSWRNYSSCLTLIRCTVF